jgi:very-short-patch-repair endonuclease
MRRQPTDAEHRLWQLLRAKRSHGWKFRRQQPIGRYIADFACHAARLIVEVDDGQHGNTADVQRDRWFTAQGFRVLRFWNNDVFNNEEGILTSIHSALEASAAASSRDGRTPLPNPSPARGEGLNGGELG